MITVNTHEAKMRLSVLHERFQKDELMLTCRNGKPAAELRAVPRKAPLRKHPLLSRVCIKGDPGAPLGSEDWPDA
jgi:antitoxin (DNA-binding transcriptional repressor) of toxin-antitoxin stability system